MDRQISHTFGSEGGVEYQRRQRQDNGTIEGGYYEHDPFRLASVLWTHSPEAEVEFGLLGSRPFVHRVVRLRDVEVHGGKVEAMKKCDVR